MNIRDRCAIVTGSGSGAGKAIAQRLAALGAIIIVTDIDESTASATADQIAVEGHRCHWLRADASDWGDITRMISLAEEQPGGLAILVNNAGGGGEKPPHFPKADPKVWEAKVELNLLAPMRSTQAALRVMEPRGEGAIVNISSIAGLGLEAYVSPEYAASKAGLIRFTSCFASPGRDVRVNCLVPGWIATERALRALDAMSPAERALADVPAPLDAVADAVVTLVQDDQLSGRALVIEGTEHPRFLDSLHDQP
jgi:NAD(P)-dependent dehydrogenase (short-subunit alcohol dehydrogenase family)